MSGGVSHGTEPWVRSLREWSKPAQEYRAAPSFGQLPGDGTPGRPSSREENLEKKVTALETRLARKDEVIAEISQEYAALKKEVGEPERLLGFPRHPRRHGGPGARALAHRHLAPGQP